MIRRFQPLERQRGAVTVFLSLLMLLLLTVLVTTALTMSTTGLKAVGNMQLRREALAAAQAAVETVLGSLFFTAPKASTIQIDTDNDGANKYLVALSTPVCVSAERASSTFVSSVTLPGMSTSSAWNTVWEFRAVVSDAPSGASVTVVQGVRVLLTQAQKDSSCK